VELFSGFWIVYKMFYCTICRVYTYQLKSIVSDAVIAKYSKGVRVKPVGVLKHFCLYVLPGEKSRMSVRKFNSGL